MDRKSLASNLIQVFFEKNLTCLHLKLIPRHRKCTPLNPVLRNILTNGVRDTKNYREEKIGVK